MKSCSPLIAGGKNLLVQTNVAILRIQQPSSLITDGGDSFALTLKKNSGGFNFSAFHATLPLADALRIELCRKLFSFATSSFLVAAIVLISPYAGAMAADANNNLDMRLTVVEKDVETLKADVSTLKADVATLKVDVSVLKSGVSSIKSDISTLKVDVSVLRQNFVEGFIALFLLISFGFANSSVSSQNMERRVKANWLAAIERMEANRLFDQNVVKENRRVDRIFMFAVALISLLSPYAVTKLNL
eukprot:gene31328-40704_t